MGKTRYDIAIIGAGIVGMATAWKLSQLRPGLKIAVVDKEPVVGQHQSSHNSGVIHSGIYYQPGSLKAKLCRAGYLELLDFAKAQGIPHEICGKLIVAVEEKERPYLQQIFRNGQANGLPGLRIIGQEEIREIEPHVQAVEAIRVPQSGIIDYLDVVKAYEQLLIRQGTDFHLDFEVQDVHLGTNTEIIGPDLSINCRLAVNCAGLYADRIGRLTEPEQKVQVLPFRGEYYELKPEATHLVRHLIYPVPDPAFPFLGVHFTRMIKGGIEAGPNAVLAFQREGYHRTQIDWSELVETLVYPGFRKIARRYWKQGWTEMQRSFSKKAFLKALQRLIPDIKSEDIRPGRAGVRAQTCRPDGTLTDDFMITARKGIVNVWNAPSPAATASLAIGETIAREALNTLE